MDKNFNVKVNESFDYELKDSDLNQLDIIKISESVFHVIHNKRSFGVHVKKRDFLNKKYWVEVNGNSYPVNISGELDQLIKKMGFSLGNTKKVNEINAPMPGIILSVNVEEGQEVKEGDTLLILEAMKMENAIGAPKDGIVKTIGVKGGGTVEKGELMIKMD